MTISIPCDTIARLSTLIDRTDEPPFNGLRLDNGRVIATDRKFMAVEQVAPFTGVFHIAVSEALVARCRDGALRSETLTVIANPALGFTMLADDTTNIHNPGDTSQWDMWWERTVQPSLERTTGNDTLVCHADQLAQLAACSPSGTLVFETHVDRMRPTVVRDVYSHDWCGFFYPRINDGTTHDAATVPSWLRTH